MAMLHLNLKGEYFSQVKAGTKPKEYRLCTPYWAKRLIDRQYDGILVKHAYPRAGDKDKIVERPWLGFTVETITHKHFGANPVEVFAIQVN